MLEHLWSLPVNYENVQGALIKQDLLEKRNKFEHSHCNEHGVVRMIVEIVAIQCW